MHDALGWNACPVRTDHAMRRHGAVGCCAFSFCWRAAEEVGHDETGWSDAAAPPESPTVAEATRGAKVRRPARATGRPGVSWPVAVRRGRAWREPWVMLVRGGRGWSAQPPPPPRQALPDWLAQGHPIALDDTS